MITVTIARAPRRVDVEGHAPDNRVCASVSAASATLVACYGASVLASGTFQWSPPAHDETAVGAFDFFANMCRVLAVRYPDDIEVKEL